MGIFSEAVEEKQEQISGLKETIDSLEKLNILYFNRIQELNEVIKTAEREEELNLGKIHELEETVRCLDRSL